MPRIENLTARTPWLVIEGWNRLFWMFPWVPRCFLGGFKRFKTVLGFCYEIWGHFRGFFWSKWSKNPCFLATPRFFFSWFWDFYHLPFCSHDVHTQHIQFLAKITHFKGPPLKFTVLKFRKKLRKNQPKSKFFVKFFQFFPQNEVFRCGTVDKHQKILTRTRKHPINLSEAKKQFSKKLHS